MTDADIAVILRRLGEQDRTMERIEDKVDKTNGRVTRLEKQQEIAEAISKIHSRSLDARKAWLIGMAAAALTGISGSIVLIALGGHA